MLYVAKLKVAAAVVAAATVVTGGGVAVVQQMAQGEPQQAQNPSKRQPEARKSEAQQEVLTEQCSTEYFRWPFAFSWDGKRAAFLDGGKIVVRDLMTGHKKRFALEESRRPQILGWSANNKVLLVCCQKTVAGKDLMRQKASMRSSGATQKSEFVYAVRPEDEKQPVALLFKPEELAAANGDPHCRVDLCVLSRNTDRAAILLGTTRKGTTFAHAVLLFADPVTSTKHWVELRDNSRNTFCWLPDGKRGVLYGMPLIGGKRQSPRFQAYAATGEPAQTSFNVPKRECHHHMLPSPDGKCILLLPRARDNTGVGRPGDDFEYAVIHGNRWHTIARSGSGPEGFWTMEEGECLAVICDQALAREEVEIKGRWAPPLPDGRKPTRWTGDFSVAKPPVFRLLRPDGSEKRTFRLNRKLPETQMAARILCAQPDGKRFILQAIRYGIDPNDPIEDQPGAYRRPKPMNTVTWLVSIQGDVLRELPIGPKSRYWPEVWWSPDGKRIAVLEGKRIQLITL